MMQEVFEKLRALQVVLSRKYEIEKEISEIPKAISTKVELLNRLKSSYEQKSTRLKKMKEDISMMRKELAEAEMQRENFEKQMDVITTQREYEVLDKEIKDATEREQDARKDIIKKEKDLEELVFAIEREEGMIKTQEEELEQEQEKIKEASEKKKIDLDELEKEEKSITPGLDEEILFKFERIIRSKSGLGIVPVKKSVCTGCHMILPAQFENEVRKGESILFCPYCSRILFFEQEKEDAPVEEIFAVEGEAGALADIDDEDDDF